MSGSVRVGNNNCFACTQVSRDIVTAIEQVAFYDGLVTPLLLNLLSIIPNRPGHPAVATGHLPLVQAWVPSEIIKQPCLPNQEKQVSIFLMQHQASVCPSLVARTAAI